MELSGELLAAGGGGSTLIAALATAIRFLKKRQDVSFEYQRRTSLYARTGMQLAFLQFEDLTAEEKLLQATVIRAKMEGELKQKDVLPDA